MMKIFFTLIIFACNLAHATTAEDLLKISKQFQNRNWHYDTALYARHAHLADYSNVELLEEAQVLIQNFVNSLQSITGDMAALFYPQSGILNDSDRITVKDRFQATVKSYDILLGWDSFLIALGTDRWEDLEGCDINAPVSNEFCGRETKGNWAVANLSDYQRQNLSAFKSVVLDELNLIENNIHNVPVGPGAARVFQFLFDSRSIPLLFQKTYASISDEVNQDLEKINKIEILRAIIVQLFQEQGGGRFDSSSNQISLRSVTCEEEKDYDCELAYIRSLFIEPSLANSLTVTNLFLDQKLIKPLMDSIVSHLREPDSYVIPEEKLNAFVKRMYFSICELQGFDPINPNLSPAYQQRVVDQLKLASEYLINNRDISGLQVARGLQNLIRFIEGQ